MELKYKENCPHCGAEIYYSDNEKLIKCTSCGSIMVVAEFLREQQKIEQRLAEGEAAKAALENAKQEKQKAQDALCETVRALDGIQTDQQDQAEKIKRILEGLQSGSAVQDNMLSLLQTLQEGQKDEASFLNRLMQNVSGGQKTTDDKLKSIGEIAGQLLQNQNRTEDMIRVLEERLIGSEQEKQNLINEYENWSKNAHKEDLERLTKIRDYSESILNMLQGFDEKIDLLHTGLNRVEEAVKGFETKWEKDKRNKLVKEYRLAEKLQKERRFDEAYKYYQDVLINEGQDPEVYWRSLMCHYCIEYQKDDEGNQVPTILYPDLSDVSDVVERTNLLEALNDTSKELRDYYMAKLNAIENLLEKYRYWQHKNDYDVFISVKQTVKENGKKYFTYDYRIGLQLYDHLTSLGLKVFNSEKTKGPAGKEWEPYILAALMSARIMIVVGTCPEYMEAQWVKNEWSRYQWLQRKETDGNRKRLLFCYLSGGMRAEDIPKGLNPSRQAIVDGIDAQAELDNAIYNILPQIGNKLNTVGEEQIIPKMDELLVNEEYDKVEQIYEEYRNQKNHNSVSVDVLLRVLCAQLRVDFVEDIPHVPVLLSEQKFFRLAKNCAERANDTNHLKQLRQMEKDNLAELNKNTSPNKTILSNVSSDTEDNKKSALQLHIKEFADHIKKNNSSKNTAGSEKEAVSTPKVFGKIKKKQEDEHAPVKTDKYDQGEASALYQLGNRYLNGWDVEQDYERAVFCYRMSADRGNVDASYMLGNCYQSGKGVGQDYEKAIFYYQKAADQGFTPAIEAIQMMK